MDTRFNFTVDALNALSPPPAGQRLTVHDAKGPNSVSGLALRVTAAGYKSFCVFRRVAGGQPQRITLGKWPDLSIAQARAKAREAINALAAGDSPSATKKAAKAVQAAPACPTLREALTEYCETATRVKDRLPLKESTQKEYLRFLKPSVVKSTGRATKPGELLPLADVRLNEITADQIRQLYDDIKTRSSRRANYAATLMRALLNFFEVPIPDNIFANKSRRRGIKIQEAGKSGKTIHPDQIGHWWAVLNDQPECDGFNYVKFLMLTGTRPCEPLGIHIKDIDTLHQSITLIDTKNRKNHTLFLSKQAWAIVEKQMAGKSPDDKLFSVYNGWKFAADLRKLSGVNFSLKVLRATFISRAEPLTSTYTLKSMVNHARSADVTQEHYLDKTEQELREAWQKVADYLDAQAASAKAATP